ncbi:hypothetical protein BDZ88DRAFT_435742 [Geranomyces variabilis]|nr:hypothetical protein BDZ88DRAFT_435742 [Geranomyces variabilis]KAJ3141656.1 hypothetical protein HDU90_005999 [Geranomyces variabilis]
MPIARTASGSSKVIMPGRAYRKLLAPQVTCSSAILTSFMRPDAHKSKATKRWKAKHGVPAVSAPDAASAATTQRRSDTRNFEGGNRDGHEQTAADHSSGDEFQEKPRSRYARRKVESNAFRYHEPTAEEIMAADAGIDRETEELRMLIREAGMARGCFCTQAIKREAGRPNARLWRFIEEEYDPSMYFQFKEERDWANVSTVVADSAIDEFNRSRLQIDFTALEASLSKLPVHVRLNISKADAVAVVEALGLGDQDSDDLESEDDQVQEAAARPAVSFSDPEPAVVLPHQLRGPEGVAASQLHKNTPTAPASISPLPQPAEPLEPELDIPLGHAGHHARDGDGLKPPEPTEDDLDFLLGTESATLPAPPPLLTPDSSHPPPPPPAAIEADLKWLDDLLN